MNIFISFIHNYSIVDNLKCKYRKLNEKPKSSVASKWCRFCLYVLFIFFFSWQNGVYDCGRARVRIRVNRNNDIAHKSTIISPYIYFLKHFPNGKWEMGVKWFLHIYICCLLYTDINVLYMSLYFYTYSTRIIMLWSTIFIKFHCRVNKQCRIFWLTL